MYIFLGINCLCGDCVLAFDATFSFVGCGKICPATFLAYVSDCVLAFDATFSFVGCGKICPATLLAYVHSCHIIFSSANLPCAPQIGSPLVVMSYEAVACPFHCRWCCGISRRFVLVSTITIKLQPHTTMGGIKKKKYNFTVKSLI